MKNCPDNRAIRKLTTDQVGNEERRQLVEHVRVCEKCQQKLRQLKHLDELLSLVKAVGGGELVLQPPMAGAASDERLKTTVLNAFRKKQQRLSPLRARLESLLSELLGTEWATRRPPAALGYGVKAKVPLRVSAESQQELSTAIVSVIEALLDPEVPLETRVRWAERLNDLLTRLRAGMSHDEADH